MLDILRLCLLEKRLLTNKHNNRLIFHAPLILLLLFFISNILSQTLAAPTNSIESTPHTSQTTPFHLSYENISQVSSLGAANLMESKFVQDSQTDSGTKPKVLAISDFNNLSDFDIDIQLLARLLLRDIQDSQHFVLTSAIAGNAFNADPMLDKIRAKRNSEKFSDIIPKGMLIAPKYSLSGRITNDTSKQGKLNVVQYHFIFSIVNLENGLVEWDYIEHITKASKEPLPNFEKESHYGRICVQHSTNTATQKQACEIAISEIWEGSFEEISDSKRALLYSYASKACSIKSSFGCRALGASYKFDKKDLKNARKYFEQSCQIGDGGGCYHLSIIYEHAQGVSQDIKRAISYAQTACNYKFNAGCENLKLLNKLNQEEKLNEYALQFQEHCNEGIGMACGNLSFYYYHGMNGVNKNHTKAAALLQRGCALNDLNSCYQLGLWEVQGLGGLNRDFDSALKHIVQACEGNIATSCKAVDSLPSDAAYIYNCHDNLKNIINVACHSAGGMYELGAGNKSKINTTKALLYYKKACDNELDIACTHYNNLQQKLK
ncbi:SEL1-like repeat protein [Helicobacter sp. MIT 14-3879]|uniref:SEL1-like repeat protein n=1 Tax=Helicobacter sp. MIT 14-3879 TaxID=2040649 RepID=UPI000E1E7BC7|nr:SEL1-like repeat protein [Helicobacter sp. MIT 14-3879]RDU59198.1 hypothetical protein CQA44_11645 [Helicobacter sp. MIT 14-3879]